MLPDDKMLGILALAERDQDKKGWGQFPCFGVAEFPEENSHGGIDYTEMPAYDEGDPNVKDWLDRLVMINMFSEGASRNFGETFPRAFAVTYSGEGYGIAVNDEEQAKAVLETKKRGGTPEDMPDGRHMRTFQMVDIWGRCYAVLRYRGGDLMIIPRATEYTNPVYLLALARILRAAVTFMPHNPEPLDKLIQKLNSSALSFLD